MSRTERFGRSRATALLGAVGAVLMALLLSAPSVAHADTLAECQQKLLDGTLDLQGYLACVAAANSTTSSSTGGGGSNNNSNVSPVRSTNTSGALPTTGSNSGRYVGVGAALIVLGGAALYGATRSRREHEAVAEPSAEE